MLSVVGGGIVGSLGGGSVVGDMPNSAVLLSFIRLRIVSISNRLRSFFSLRFEG